jgi:hypothetical protein
MKQAVLRKLCNPFKLLVERERSLTRNLEVEVLADMRARYRTAFWLDEEFVAAQAAVASSRSNNSVAGLSNSTTDPVAPWGLILACAGLALSLTFIMGIVVMGGLDLG